MMGAGQQAVGEDSCHDSGDISAGAFDASVEISEQTGRAVPVNLVRIS